MSDTKFPRATVLILAAVTSLAPAACGWPGTGQPNTATAAGPEARIEPNTPLAQALLLLRAELDSAVESGLDDDGVRNLDRAEVISDRLLETRLPFAWIRAESYSLEARLRQIQSRADRAVSLRVGGARREDILSEIRLLTEALDSLRLDIARGGTSAPAPIDQLLIRLDTSRR
jgi:hypothetical protein